MKDINLYIFTIDGRANGYGIGTYLNCLIDSVKKEKNIHLTLIKFFCEGERELKIEEEDGYQQIAIPSIPNPRNLNNIERYIRNSIYVLKTIIPDAKNTIFHIHSTLYFNNIAVWLKQLFQSKILLTLHYTEWSLDLLGDTKQLRQILAKNEEELTEDIEKHIHKGIERDRTIVEHCDKIICIAQHSLDAAKEFFGIESNRICLIPNGLKDEFQPLSETQKNKLKQKLYILENEKIIVFAGRLDEVKGIPFLLKAFSKVLKKHQNTRLILAGEGSFEQWIPLTNGLGTKVTFTGRLNKKQLFDLYRIADIGVMPSVHEEFGLVALEMMMHALPIIVTDTGGLKEIVETGKTGLKIPIQKKNNKPCVNTSALEQQICHLLENQNFALQLGQNARNVFLQKYECKHFKQKMLALYTKLIH